MPNVLGAQGLATKRARTQWAAQFLAAAEMVRRGYTVSFTMGNHTPLADLMVGTPTGVQFWVDVKGLASKTTWLLTPKRAHQNLFYVLVYLAPLAVPGAPRNTDEFFVLTQSEANDLLAAYRLNHPRDRGLIPGFGWGDVASFREQWEKLPQPIEPIMRGQ